MELAHKGIGLCALVSQRQVVQHPVGSQGQHDHLLGIGLGLIQRLLEHLGQGFAVFQLAAGEASLYALNVDPAARRKGVGAALLAGALAALQAEGAAIRERLPKGGAVVALCIEGKPCSSDELSRRMADFGVQGKTQITFLIGGSVGLSEDVKKLADWRLSMSPMTFPHHMARIMLLEQLYRAYQIAAGTKYHK